MDGISIQIDNPGKQEIAEMIARLDVYLNDLYPAESNHLLDITALQANDIVFVSCRFGECYVGCGALKRHDEGYGELKRIYVDEDFRGKQFGRRIVAALENIALGHGIKTVRLETGIYQEEANRLYSQMGYQLIGPFGSYKEDPFSVFYEKNLVGKPVLL